ncbi:hypothetical protein TW81_13490 [Vibrio galatheae]|uniref:Uncharacterized protein n=1 Tax=Vibrio galatheae TaxID=579748 RepID=A0A0F4NK39_9VIBR|nr:hypothetical protein [Vibrio galatheae]KJY82421.1 hypothetical protein TW81_13490 [Vibrio galatheae]
MTDCVAADPEGFLYLTSDPIESCTQFVVLSADEYNFFTSYTSITGTEVVEFYSFGFALVFFGYIISFPIKAALKAINLI